MLHLTAANYDTTTEKSTRAVVMFYAVWCGKCAMMKPVAEDIEKKYSGRITFCEVNIDECEDLAARYDADIVPTFLFYLNGKIAGKLKGIIGQEILEERMKRILNLEQTR